ncbi:MAG: peroxiredoxin [gamma proteobacterium symbiont of Ctena orbiculata]|uniref:thioredoxin-dependent peroxiredoxin n=1 Tax=Candidatus Thiodiazotropha taylori TaxID=2792791 RepID=A0A944MEV7_9GAMM|nr:peroxiredoxin [Candidatus Thiodiazotropha taylori]PUB89339.1 MAG: peroxiredoxin [gamma proteobacterium symbiont of Ctena orbiculata]MBT2989730.1 peroxiredoxin [Candidatus Thiodiazotropha taylori]MBT2995931.1 peroxiredoxin [Candidatus Thiodiazotropha taylori]MBT2999246.1 peroxiredoxin [Candidatus Thiodiazotropha taylori]
MPVITIGKAVPKIELHATGDQKIKLTDFHGKPIVLYFYPKASTPGCTQEGLDFSAAIAKFRRQSAVILGVSRDSLKAQENFKKKQGFPFELIADTEEKLCSAFNVIKMKSMYGKQVRGIERSTFLIDEGGRLRQEWRKVKVKGHVDEVLETLKAMRAGKLA